MIKKHITADLALSYPMKIELGIILSLSILILISNIKLPEKPAKPIYYAESDEAAIVLPPPVSGNTEILKPPPVPQVPITIPDDAPIEIFKLDFSEFDQNSRIEVPPLAKEIEIKVDYEKLSKIEVLPELIGGEDAFRKSIEYPYQARLAGIEGIVEVEFIVDRHGKVLQPVIVRGIGGGCDKAVLQAIKIQRYKPGKKNGKLSQFKIRETVQFILLDA